MHRVELKGPRSKKQSGWQELVPNAPCGVESIIKQGQVNKQSWVPNAPCGVERKLPIS